MTNTPILRPEYQMPLVNDIRKAISENNKGHYIIQLGTGGGKTFIFSYITYHANLKGNRVFIGTDRTELLSQASSSIAQFGIKHSFINPKTRKPDFSSPTVIGMAQTILRRYEKPEWRKMLESFDIYILDEMHKQVFNYLFESGILDNKLVLGFSATPIRTGKMRQLGMDYDKIIQGVSVREMVEMGYLAPDRYYSVDDIDVSKIPYNPMTGDLKSSALYSMMNNREKYTGVVDNYRRIADKTKAITFCVNVSHAIKTTVEFNRAGISSRFLVSGITMPKKPLSFKNDAHRLLYEENLEAYITLMQYKRFTADRKTLLNDYKHNRFLNLVNVDIATTGFDMPDIVTGIINRSTISQVLYSQMTGRLSRIHPESGKTHFNLLDMGNHLQREVLPLKGYMEEMKFGLWHLEQKGGGISPMKLCPPDKKDKRKTVGCGRLINISAKICPFCFYEFSTKQQEKEVELKEIIYGNAVEESVLVKNMNIRQLQAYAKLKKYKISWIGRVLYARGGADEVYRGLKEIGYKHYYIREYVLKYIKK